MQLDIVDVTLSADTDGEARVNLGDVATGAGFVSAATTWGSGDGFIGIPNPASGGGAAQALQITEGNLRYALAVRDTRYDQSVGALAPGDRAIVSNCAAGLLLDQSENAIALQAGDVSVTVDGDAGTATLAKGAYAATVNNSGVHATVGSTSIDVGPSAITFTVGPLVIVATGSTFSIAMTSGLATLLVNGVAVTVP